MRKNEERKNFLIWSFSPTATFFSLTQDDEKEENRFLYGIGKRTEKKLQDNDRIIRKFVYNSLRNENERLNVSIWTSKEIPSGFIKKKFFFSSFSCRNAFECKGKEIRSHSLLIGKSLKSHLASYAYQVKQFSTHKNRFESS